MKDFVFPYSISYGKHDSVGNSLTVSLSDVNAKRLIRSAEEGGRNAGIKQMADPAEISRRFLV